MSGEASLEAVDNLKAALDAFGAALLGCLQVGLQPADALRAAGIDVPLFAGPMVDRALANMLEESSGEELQS